MQARDWCSLSRKWERDEGPPLGWVPVPPLKSNDSKRAS